MNDFTSLVLYIACFSISAFLLSVGIKRASRLIRLVSLSIPILLVGLRVDVGTDYESYASIFEQYAGTNITIPSTEAGAGIIESGFLWLIKIGSLFSDQAWSMFLLSAVLTVGIAYLAILRLSPKNIPITFLLYLLVVVPFAMNGVRQGIAVSIVFFAYSYIIAGKPFKYLLTIFLASLFHTSALAILPLYLLRYITVKKRIDSSLTLLLASVTTVLLAVAVPAVLWLVSTVPALSTYVRYVGFESGIAWGPIAAAIVIAVIAIALHKRLSELHPSMQLMMVLLFLELAALYLGWVSAAFARMSYYMTIGGLVCLSNVPTVFSYRTRRVLQFAVIGYGVLYFTYFYYVNGYSDIIPYSHILGAAL